MINTISKLIEYIVSLSNCSVIIIYAAIAFAVGGIVCRFWLVRSNTFKYCEKCHCKLRLASHECGILGEYDLMKCPKCGHEKSKYKAFRE